MIWLSMAIIIQGGLLLYYSLKITRLEEKATENRKWIKALQDRVSKMMEEVR